MFWLGLRRCTRVRTGWLLTPWNDEEPAPVSQLRHRPGPATTHGSTYDGSTADDGPSVRTAANDGSTDGTTNGPTNGPAVWSTSGKTTAFLMLFDNFDYILVILALHV